VSDLRDYLDAVLGTTEGWLTGAFGIGGYFDENGKYKFKEFRPRFYPWPADADRVEREFLQEAYVSDVYLCPYVMRYAKRAKHDAVVRQLAHTDVDGALLDLDRVRELGGFAVGSGTPGHGHAYVRLSEPVTGSQHEALCRGLSAQLNGDPAKISDNDVLRPPGTFNHKPVALGGDAAAPVEWLVRP
jgi:hypothetical protein